MIRAYPATPVSMTTFRLPNGEVVPVPALVGTARLQVPVVARVTTAPVLELMTPALPSMCTLLRLSLVVVIRLAR